MDASAIHYIYVYLWLKRGAMISIDFSIVVCETCALHKLWTNMWLQEVSYTALCLCPVFFFYSGVVTLTAAHTHTHMWMAPFYACIILLSLSIFSVYTSVMPLLSWLFSHCPKVCHQKWLAKEMTLYKKVLKIGETYILINAVLFAAK